MLVTIYMLIDPLSNRIRYVGKCMNLAERLRRHLRDKHPSHKASWIKSLSQKNLRPIIAELEVCSVEIWERRERYWIKKFRSLGHKLTNMNEGGVGGGTPSQAVRDKISKALLGKSLSEAHIAAISKSLTGLPKKPAHRAKLTKLCAKYNAARTIHR